MRLRSLFRRDRRCTLRTMVLLVYLTTLAAMPMLHHDVACHVKTPTHCTTCLAGAAEKVPDQSALLATQLVPIGSSSGHAQVGASPGLAWEFSGRSPPAIA